MHPFVHTASQGAFPVLQHHWCRLEAIAAVRFAQSTETNLKTFLEGVRLSYLFPLFATNRPTFMLLIVIISQTNSANLKQSLCLFLFCSFLGRRPLVTHCSSLKVIKERFLNKNICLHVTNGRRSDHGNILNFNAPQIRIWSIRHFLLIRFLITVFS